MPGTSSRKSIEAPAEERVKECFSMETMVQEYERVYAIVLETEAKKKP